MKNIKLINQSVTGDWEQKIYENDGSFSDKDLYMVFDMNGDEVIINFDIVVCAKIKSCFGDFLTAPSQDITNIDVDVEITGFSINDNESDFVKKDIEDIVKTHLNIK